MSENPSTLRITRKHVPTGLHLRAKFFHATAGFWKRLAALETAALREELASITIDRPIYITGVARAGTTILTEILSRHPDVTSHRYSDFPNLYTPYWRNWLASRIRRSSPQPVERAHRDRILVTPESPEAVEEVLWMQFFGHLHDPARSQVLDAVTEMPAFVTFYTDHVRKLLAVRGAKRYLAKGNYNVTRLEYLNMLFPDARFIVPVRNPVNHVASLMKQDRLFHRASTEDPRVPRQLALGGHFEFGPGRRPIHTGDAHTAQAIERAWAEGDGVQGWSLYWSSVYAHVLARVEDHARLRDAVHFVRYEDLCRHPSAALDTIIEHCELPATPFEPIRDEYAGRLKEPDYYRPDFSRKERDTLNRITRATASRFGYEI